MIKQFKAWVMSVLNLAMAGVGLFLAARNLSAQTAQPDIAVELPVGQTETRGIKNRNPGNVTVLSGGQKWRGQIGVDVAPDGHQYAVFDTQHNGLRTCAKLLRNYQRLHGLQSIGELINRYAPPTANPTSDYADFVARAMQVQVYTPLVLTDDVTLAELVKAVVHFENGFQPFGTHTIMLAVADI